MHNTSRNGLVHYNKHELAIIKIRPARYNKHELAIAVGGSAHYNKHELAITVGGSAHNNKHELSIMADILFNTVYMDTKSCP